LEPFWKSLISNLLPEKGRAKTVKSQQNSQQNIEFCPALLEFVITRFLPARYSLTGFAKFFVG
jgi:hypothetical protein